MQYSILILLTFAFYSGARFSSVHSSKLPSNRFVDAARFVTPRSRSFFASKPAITGPLDVTNVLRSTSYENRLLCINANCKTREVSTNALFEYCPLVPELNGFEFQVAISMNPFVGKGAASLRVNAANLFVDFLRNDVEALEADTEFKESTFDEKSWLLTTIDGEPLPFDAATHPPYATSSYVRTRTKRKISKDGEIDENVDIVSSIKIRNINPSKFDDPKGDFKDDIECDVYSDVHRATYKATQKHLKAFVSFDTFKTVVKLFPFASEIFLIPEDAKLPERDAYVTHRFNWKHVSILGVAMECDLDLRFHDEQSAIAGANPYTGEFSCTLELKKVEQAQGSTSALIARLKQIFTKFHSSPSWIDHGM